MTESKEHETNIKVSLEDERWEAHDELRKAFDKLADERWSGHRREHDAERDARKVALEAMEKRLDGMNEFRDQLRDQAANFVRIEVLGSLEKQMREAIAALDKRLDTEREERRDQQTLKTGQEQGMSRSAAIIVTSVGIVGTLLGAFAILLNILK